MSNDHDEQALEYQRMADTWQDETVPAWNRARHLVQPQRAATPPWLQWSALVASVMALALSLSHAEIDTRNGLVIRFGGHDEAQLKQLAAAAMAEAGATQTAVLDARLQQFAYDMEQSNKLALTTWQDTERRERRQDLGVMVSDLQNQRFQDQQTLNTRFNQLVNDQFENTQHFNSLLQTAANRPGRRDL
ncbi:MAG TPA: hypothetical protein VMH83_05405 [Candidatus Acidoferrum sp.]|nr:hypothetical protein [Candidatus Acidoferrum sp.]